MILLLSIFDAIACVEWSLIRTRIRNRCVRQLTCLFGWAGFYGWCYWRIICRTLGAALVLFVVSVWDFVLVPAALIQPLLAVAPATIALNQAIGPLFTTLQAGLRAV
jgi:hypothetical protein